MKLVIGNKNYSTWSLRPWLLLTEYSIPFEEIRESVTQDRIGERLGKYSPSCRVPVLIDGELTIWDSMAICEYVSETYLDQKGWPENMAARAAARSICAEMHAGFNALRAEMPMNIRATRTVELSAAARQDIRRIDSIWSEYTRRYAAEGDWLFGKFSIADCMYAPVALRFITYGIELSAQAGRYVATVTGNSSVKLWIAAAKQETEIVPEDEAGI